MGRTITQEFSGKVWGNGQFGLARCKSLSPCGTSSSVAGSDASRWSTSVSVHGVLPTLQFVRSDDEYLHNERWNLLPVSSERGDGVSGLPIGSSNLPKRHRRGVKGITSHGKKVVRNAASLLQRKFGKNRLSFLTLTLPGMADEDLSLICDDWSRITKVFVQKLKRRLLSCGLSGGIVGVTEIQEGRLRSGGGFALHLHLVFQGAKRPYQWEVSPCEFREMWASVLESVVPRERWSDARALENVKSIRFSVDGYLGKYISKGCKSISECREIDPDISLPSAWWFCTYELRREVLKDVCYVSERSAAYLLELVETCPDLFDYVVPVRVAYRGGCLGVGYAGRIKPDRVREVRKVLYALKKDRSISLGGYAV